jgi:hypothetical protein
VKHIALFESFQKWEAVMKEVSHAIAPMCTLWTIKANSTNPGVALDLEFEDWNNYPTIPKDKGIKLVSRIDRDLIDWKTFDFYTFYDIVIPHAAIDIANKNGLAYMQSVGIHDSRALKAKEMWLGILFQESSALMHKHRGKISKKKFEF